MRLTTETITKVTGVAFTQEETETIDDVFIPAVNAEISNYCNQDFVPPPPPNDESGATPPPEYPTDLCLAAAKRVVELYQNRAQTSSKEVKAEQVGGMKVEYFESDNSGKSDDWHAALDKYRIPSL